jgi:hypothetical protein
MFPIQCFKDRQCLRACGAGERAGGAGTRGRREIKKRGGGNGGKERANNAGEKAPEVTYTHTHTHAHTYMNTRNNNNNNKNKNSNINSTRTTTTTRTKLPPPPAAHIPCRIRKARRCPRLAARRDGIDSNCLNASCVCVWGGGGERERERERERKGGGVRPG